MFEVGKTYKTRGGNDARVICIDAKDRQYPIVALVSVGDDEGVESYSSAGRYYSEGAEDEFDLLLEKRKAWVNVYHNDICGPYPDRGEADRQCERTTRIACVEIEYVPGQGL